MQVLENDAERKESIYVFSRQDCEISVDGGRGGASVVTGTGRFEIVVGAGTITSGAAPVSIGATDITDFAGFAME